MRSFRLQIGTSLLAACLMAAGSLPASAQGFGFGFDDRERAPFSELLCAQEPQVRRLVAAEGYTNIFLNARQGRYIQVRATRGNWVYLLEFDRCGRRIVDERRLRRAR